MVKIRLQINHFGTRSRIISAPIGYGPSWELIELDEKPTDIRKVFICYANYTVKPYRKNGNLLNHLSKLMMQYYGGRQTVVSFNYTAGHHNL